MIEDKEISRVRKEIHGLKGIDYELIPYSYTYLEGLQHESEKAKRSPLFSQVWEVLESRRSAFDYLGFVNSDIEYHSCGKDCSLNRLIGQEGQCASTLILSRRIDYDTTIDRQIGEYLDGYDVFLIRSGGMPLNTCIFSRCRIGQVGWDYFVPLCQDKGNVALLPSTSTFHRIHQTGSSKKWEQEVIDVFLCSHQSWYNSSSIMSYGRRHMLFIYTSCRIITKRLPRAWQRFTKDLIDYFSARIVYYFFIKNALKSMTMI